MQKEKCESDEYPGFYVVPGFMTTLINDQGIVIDIRKNWCPLPTINMDGYPCVNSENNRQFIHRLLALTFLEPPITGIDDLDVNHIDGVKSNNALSNLEWATRSENCFHAYRSGLRTDNIPVLVKDLRTGEIKRFYSMSDCGRAMNVTQTTVFNQLRHCSYGKIAWKYYHVIREGDEWPCYNPDDIGKHRNGDPKAVVATKIDGSLRIIFDSCSDATREFGWKPSTLAMHMYRYGAKPYHGWVFRFIDDKEISRTSHKENKSYPSVMME